MKTKNVYITPLTVALPIFPSSLMASSQPTDNPPTGNIDSTQGDYIIGG